MPIDEETSDSFELGIKSRFADNRIQVNASAFQVTYDGFQANNFVLLNGAVVTNLTNAGTVRSTGFELDILANPVEGLDLFANIAYADAKVKRFNPNPLTNAPDARNGTRSAAGSRMELEHRRGLRNAVPACSVRSIRSMSAPPIIMSARNSPISAKADRLQAMVCGMQVSVIRMPTIITALTFMMKNITDDSYVLLNTSAGQRLHIPRDADRYMGASLRVRF